MTDYSGLIGETLIEFPTPNESQAKSPVELFDQDAAVLPVPLRCGLCGERFKLPPWDPRDGSKCSGCGATTFVSRDVMPR